MIEWDLHGADPLPVQNGTAEAVYTDHTVEHITDAAAGRLFAEAYRVLKPGGVLRVTTPDADLELDALLRGDREFFYWIDRYSDPKVMARSVVAYPMREASLTQVFLHHVASSVSTLHGDSSAERVSDEEFARLLAERGREAALDECTARCPFDVQVRYPGNHINWWTHDKTKRMLRSAGFETVYRSGCGQSASAAMRNTVLFDNTHPKISLYVEAVR